MQQAATIKNRAKFALLRWVCSLTGAILLPLVLVGQVSFTEITEGPLVTERGCSGFGSWADFDNDGYADLSVRRDTPGSEVNHNFVIYRNNHDGTFSAIPSPLGLGDADYRGWGWCDWDNDGHQDVFAILEGQAHIGYGDGQGDFSLEVPSATIGSWGAHADYDRDGLLDGYWSYRSLGNRLIHNAGGRDFIEYSGLSQGPASLHTYGGSCAADFDEDGWPDLYVPCLRDSRSYLFRNNGNLEFVPVTNLITETPGPSFQAAWGDYDNDDRLDLFVARFNGTSTLYRNLGSGEFDSPPGAPTLTGPHNFVAWLDYDNDGFLDLWVSGGWTENKLFHNNGDGSFNRVTTESVVTERPLNNGWTYQVAWFDYDNDGFLDAYVMNSDDNKSIWTANQLFHNDGNENAWLTVRPVGTVSNRDGVGAKVRILAAYAGQARWQRRDISGGTTSNGNHRYAHFGLGDATIANTLRIEWPSGIVQELKDVAPNQILTVMEPPRLIPQAAGRFQIQCWLNQRFEVHCSSDLTTWTPVMTVTNETGTLTFGDVETDQHDCRYYRVTEARKNMVWISPGTFMMGSPETEQDRNEREGPQTEVTLTQGFWMGRYEVTQGEYLAVMCENPSWFNGDRSTSGWGVDFGTDLQRPVEMVSWQDAVAYCGARTQQERGSKRIPGGFSYRLPTEAEWEYACRAGTATRFCYGDDPAVCQLDDYGWWQNNSGYVTHRVGQKLANPWGLYDMHGDVWEHTADWWSGSLPGGCVVDPTGPETGPGHVPRGGSWSDRPERCRSADRRGYVPPTEKYPDLGFRVVLAPARP